jgi:3-oxoacyl-[acyl-carrier-protein] synthase-1
MNKRVLITGTGAVSGAGRTPDEMLDALLSARSAIRPIEGWDTNAWPVREAAEIPNFNARALVEDRKLHKLIRRTDLIGIYAGDRAAEAAGYASYRETLSEGDSATFADRTGIYVGSGGGAFENQYDYFPLMSESHGDLRKFGQNLADTVNPMWLLRTLPNNVLCHVGIRNRLKGSNACITNHSVGGMLAVIETTEALRNDEADRAIAIGHDTPIEPQNVLYYHACGLLSSEGLKPFDASRKGSVLGEGAGAFALESEASVRERNVPVLGEILGGGYVTEGSGLLTIRDDGDGVARSIRAALDDAAIDASAVGMIVAHGNGTELSDASEALAIKRVFGERCPPITAFKWALGHLIAAAGIVEATIALAALRQRVVPAIATLDNMSAECAGLPFTRERATPRGDVALVLSRGFAGTDAALLIRAASA